MSPDLRYIYSCEYDMSRLTILIPAMLRYLLPLLVAFLSFALRWLADFTCSSWSQTCRASSELLSHIYMVVFFFLAIVASTKAKQISDLFDRLRAAINLIMDKKEKRE